MKSLFLASAFIRTRDGYRASGGVVKRDSTRSDATRARARRMVAEATGTTNAFSKGDAAW